MIRIGIVTASDKGSRGEREDLSAGVIREMVEEIGDVVAYRMVPDERRILADTMRTMIDSEEVDLVLTTGGTGFSPRDVTPEATMDIVERPVPGIPEAMRAASLAITNRAMLTRSVAGIRGSSLIINLPGSPKACRECLDVVLPVLEHGLDILKGLDGECAR